MSWSSIKTEAIILRMDPVREADRRYRALTPAHGKIEFLGRGASKGKAKLASHLESFSVVDLEIIRGRRSTTVISVDRSQLFRNINTIFELRLLVHSSLVLLDRYTHELHEDEDLYQELLGWMRFLDNQKELSSSRSAFLLGGFLLRCLKHLGYDVELRHCLSCKEPVFPLCYRWHGGKGGLVCTSCTETEKEEWFAARILPEEVVKLLRFARDTDYENLLKVPLPGVHIEEFAKTLQDLIVFHVPGAHERPFWTGIL